MLKKCENYILKQIVGWMHALKNNMFIIIIRGEKLFINDSIFKSNLSFYLIIWNNI
jgi:hypothetical protein